jgi:dihydroorotate dehydrogenase electron transfer subunit
VSEAPFGRRLLTVTGVDQLGAYRVLRAADPDGGQAASAQPGHAPAPEPGQFAMLAAAERWGGGDHERPYLPRAFSYARHSDGESQFLLEDVGPGTRRLCELRAGEGLWALGPLGNGFTVGGLDSDRRRALLVGGGVGIAPLAILQDTLDARGAPTTVLLGFRDSAHAHGAGLLREALIATDDGSVGHHGLVTELLEAEIERDPHALVYACGPPPMLEGVRALCEGSGVPAQLALEAGMACGYGACFGCVVPRRGGGYLRVCVDGPVVDAAQLESVDGAHAGRHAGASA